MVLTAGVLLNVLVPDWLQTLLLTVLLLFVINKTVRKGITQWRQEQKAIKQKRSLAEHAVRPTHSTTTGCPHRQCCPRIAAQLQLCTLSCRESRKSLQKTVGLVLIWYPAIRFAGMHLQSTMAIFRVSEIICRSMTECETYQ